MASTLSRCESSGSLPVGHLNAAPVDNEELLHRIVEACQTISRYPGIFARMRRSMMRRVEACMESHGGHFEHLLQSTISAVAHKLNVSGHMLMCTFFLVLVRGILVFLSLMGLSV
jgi:hypothetical protein